MGEHLNVNRQTANLEHGGWAESIHCLTVIKQTVGPVSNGNNLVASEMYINTRADKMSRTNLYEKIWILFFFFGGRGGVFIYRNNIGFFLYQYIRYQTWSESTRKFANFVHTFQENFKHTHIVQSIHLIRKDTCFWMRSVRVWLTVESL